MTLAAKCGDKLLIQVNGDGENDLLNQLKAIVSAPISH
jgi:phosphotransferase system HPr-like phosphotransfer protein